MSGGSGNLVHLNPAARRVFGATEDGVGEGRVAHVDTGDGENVLFSHEFPGTLLALVSTVAASKLVAVEAMVSTTESSLKNDEGKAR